jgi:hypothetical protein
VGTSVTPFEVYVHSDCPVPHYPDLVLDLSGDLGYSTSDTFTLMIGMSGYTSDVEDITGWTHAACQGGFTDEWHWSTERYNSASHAWKCGTVGGQYSNLLDACLVTPEFLLAPNSELTFFHWIDAETSAYYTGECYDAGIVQIQIDGGAWETITPEGGYPYPIRSGSGHPFPGVPGYSGYYPTWRQATFDLSGYSGSAMIRFRFGSDQGTVAEGWYIDDVVIAAGAYGPDIDLDPWSFAASLSPDDSSTAPLSIMNEGGAQLTFDIVVETDSARVSGRKIVGSQLRSDWLDVNPSAGSVAPDASEVVDVIFNTAGMTEGTYWGRLRVNSNDPDESWLIVPVELEVISELCGDVNGDESVTTADGYYTLNYFGAGPEPTSCWAANVNGDGSLTTGDGFHLLNYFGSGPALNCAPCDLTGSGGRPVLRESREPSKSE